MLGVRFYVLVGLIIGTTSNAIAEDYILPAGVSVLTEEQLLNQAIGNTFFTKRWAEYYEPPSGNLKKGTFTGKQLKSPISGSWEIDGPFICFQYDQAYLAEYNTCYSIAIDGDNATWYKTDGSLWYPRGGRIKLISGNPKNL